MRKRLSVILILVLRMMMCACGSSGSTTGLSTEDEQKVVNYSSGVIAKHSSTRSERIADESEVKAAYQKELDLEAKKANFQAQQAAAEAASQNADKSSASGDSTEPAMTMAEALGLSSDFSVSFKGYDICDDYPADDSGDNSFKMTAAADDKLVVMHFEITNVSGADAECDILDGSPIFRTVINDKKYSVLTTLLLNDLATYKDTVSVSAPVDLVLISEINADAASDVSSLSLIIKSADGMPRYTLQ